MGHLGRLVERQMGRSGPIGPTWAVAAAGAILQTVDARSIWAAQDLLIVHGQKIFRRMAAFTPDNSLVAIPRPELTGADDPLSHLLAVLRPRVAALGVVADGRGVVVQCCTSGRHSVRSGSQTCWTWRRAGNHMAAR